MTRQLADGAKRLPPGHLTARVPWNDTDWSGVVCAHPGSNHSCSVLARIAEDKDSDSEEPHAGKRWEDLPTRELPPCVLERGGFMRHREFSLERKHPYASWSPAHSHFGPTVQRMPAYSIEAIPFRWMMRDEAEVFASAWGIDYDKQFEDDADYRIDPGGKKTTWVQDHRNQIALLDSFFSTIEPSRSLVFLYAKDVPLLAETEPAARILVGVGRVLNVDSPVEWAYTSKNGPLRSYMWERNIQHSIRPTFEDGFLLPFQQLLNSEALAGKDLSDLIARAPSEHFEQYSYVTERLDDDGAIASLNELARVVDALPAYVDGPWQQCAEWISDRLGELWELRGPYPGLGVVLSAAGIQQGHAIAHRVVDEMSEDDIDVWGRLEQMIEDSHLKASPLAGLMGRMSRKVWDRISAEPSKYEVVKALSRFSLSTAQAVRAYERYAAGRSGELLANPYLPFEEDLDAQDRISLGAIDRGVFPKSTRAKRLLDEADLGESVSEQFDDRRVRASAIEVLLNAAEQGHTLLDEPRIRERISKLGLEPRCDPTNQQWEISTEDFEPHLRECELASTGRGWQLPQLSETTKLITGAVTALIASPVQANEVDWEDAVEELLGPISEGLSEQQRAEELDARGEKIRALRAIANSNIVAVAGGAGTGKTTMLQAFCAQTSVAGRVLLLAPTGKARVQLGDKVGTQAQTLAQFLRRAKRWSLERGYFLNGDGVNSGGFETVIVDEASMLTEAMLAALIQSLKPPYRLVLCGDHRQLPPIGAGRPFVDLIARLRSGAESGEQGAGFAELSTTRRQSKGGVSVASRDDLAAAAAFASDSPSAGADEALARAISGESDDTIQIISWVDGDDLEEKLEEALSTAGLGLEERSRAGLAGSLGAVIDERGRVSFAPGDSGTGAENWQLLSPVRARAGGVDQLNRMVRSTWRPGDAARALRSESLPNPFGADGVLLGDKVLSTINQSKETYDPASKVKADGYVANGEIGMVTSWLKKKGIRVEFSTQSNATYTYWYDDLGGGFGDANEPLSVAYAMTIHKSQGSQFETTFVVVPNPCSILSPELLYTALTRHQDRVVLLVQGDPNDLRDLADPARSETARRLTNLFRAPDPFTTLDGTLLDGSHVHRSANGELMRSKSEVIVADALREFDIEYEYEELLRMDDGTVREPDFTIRRPGEPPVYWEHLGMLDLHGYRTKWAAKKEWYAAHGILPADDGGGSAGTLVWSTEGVESAGIDSAAVRDQIRRVFR